MGQTRKVRRRELSAGCSWSLLAGRRENPNSYFWRGHGMGGGIGGTLVVVIEEEKTQKTEEEEEICSLLNVKKVNITT